jgi:NADH-quinone oxidoreductase subunit M
MLLFLIIFILCIAINIILVGNLFKIQQDLVRSISLISSISCFFLSLFFLIFFDRSTTHYQATINDFYTSYLSVKLSELLPIDFFLSINHVVISFGIDGISLFFVLLTTFLIPICLLTSYKKGLTQVIDYCLALLSLELFTIFAFVAMDLITFFIFFESILIPMFFLIGI